MYPDGMPGAFTFNRIALSGLEAVAKKLVERMGQVRVCVLEGEMGAGKTTFIKAIGSVLKVKDTMSSPTFSIINEYQTAVGTNIYHFDFYKIKSEAEAYDIGTEEYFYSGNYCFVEWPEKIPSLLPDVYVHIKILVEDDSHRTFEIAIHAGKEKKRV